MQKPHPQSVQIRAGAWRALPFRKECLPETKKKQGNVPSSTPLLEFNYAITAVQNTLAFLNSHTTLLGTN